MNQEIFLKYDKKEKWKKGKEPLKPRYPADIVNLPEDLQEIRAIKKAEMKINIYKKKNK